MSADNLTRLRNDLQTIEAALVLPPRDDPQEMRINLLFAVAGLACMAWVLAQNEFSPFIGLAFLAVPTIAWMGSAKTDANYNVGRECGAALRTLWLVIPLMALFTWTQRVGLPPLTYLGLATFLIGSLLFSAAVGEKQRNSVLGWAVALMAGGLLLPLDITNTVAVFGATLASGGLLSAAILFVTREELSSHAPG